MSLISHANNKLVCAEEEGKQSLIPNRIQIGPWETFTLIDLGRGNVALQSHANNRYVCAEDGGKSPLIANRDAIGPWETFKVTNLWEWSNKIYIKYFFVLQLINTIR